MRETLEKSSDSDSASSSRCPAPSAAAAGFALAIAGGTFPLRRSVPRLVDRNQA